MTLEDYKDVVGAAAVFVTFCQMFSGVFLCKDIYYVGSTNLMSPMPFIGGLVLSILFYRYGLLLNDSAVGFTNLFGLIINICYLIFYYLWTTDNKKNDFWKQLMKGVVLVSVILCYAQIENQEKIQFRFEIIITVLLLGLMASPLFSLGEVIRTKSTQSLPFPMILSGFIVSAHWLLYGVIIKNSSIIFQNTVGSLLCLIQLSLFLIYPRTAKSKIN